MSSKPSKNDGSCLGYFIALAFIYYIYDKYGAIIGGFFKGILIVVAAGVLIWLAFFIIFKIIEAIFNYISNKNSSDPEDTPKATVCDDIILNSSFQEQVTDTIPIPLTKFEIDENHISDYIKHCRQQLNEAAHLADIVNTTTDRKEFFSSFDEITLILNSLMVFEGVIDFATLPSKMLEEIVANKKKSIEALEKRIEEKEKLSVEKVTSDQNNLSNAKLYDHIVSSYTNNLYDNHYEYYNGKFDYMTGEDFEEYCAHLLHEVGFLDVTTTSASNDFGVDILAKYNNVLYAFQCKRYSSSIGIKAVQEVSSGMKYYHANVGIVITNQYYTSQAQELASAVGVILWDRDFLQKLIKASIEGTDLLPLMLGSNQTY